MIFNNTKHYDTLPLSDFELKEYLNYNPVHNEYTRRQNFPERNPNETDRAGWRGYDRVYTQYFKSIKKDKLNVLEIGIKEGYGIYAWQKYFENATIYGIDNDWNPSIIQQRDNIKRKHSLFRKARLYNLDSTREDNWLQFYGKKFDVIIDDGDHNPKSQIETLKCAWKYLKNNGLYFIEDIGHRYGEDKLIELSNVIESMKHEFLDIRIYNHDNAGLKRTLKNKDVSTLEYILSIRKK